MGFIVVVVVYVYGGTEIRGCLLIMVAKLHPRANPGPIFKTWYMGEMCRLKS